jgi:hypothetical protein
MTLRLPSPTRFTGSLEDAWPKIYMATNNDTHQGFYWRRTILAWRSLSKEAICNHSLIYKRGGLARQKEDETENQHTIHWSSSIASLRDLWSFPLVPACNPYYEQSGSDRACHCRLKVGMFSPNQYKSCAHWAHHPDPNTHTQIYSLVLVWNTDTSSECDSDDRDDDKPSLDEFAHAVNCFEDFFTKQKAQLKFLKSMLVSSPNDYKNFLGKFETIAYFKV